MNNRAEQIAAVLESPGWRAISEMIDAEIAGASTKVMTLLVKSPVRLTKDDVLKLSAGVKKLIEFRENVQAAGKIWPQSDKDRLETDGKDGGLTP